MKSTEKRKKKLLGAAAALALVASLAGTFAWQTYQDQKLNRVRSAEVVSDAVKVTETWSKTPITPGGSATKDAKVTNSSDVQVFVRASFEEVMKHLASQGKETDVATPTTYDPATAGLTDNVPVPYAGDATTLAAQGWKQITTFTGGALPTGVEVWAKGEATQNPVTPAQIDYSFEYKVFYKYQIGTTDHYQKMSADVSHDGTAAAGAAVDSWKINATGFKYYEYTGGYTYESYNWAKSSLLSEFAQAVTPTPPTTSDTALIGYTGTNNGETFDYTTAAGVPLPASVSLLTIEPTTGQEVSVFGDSDTTKFGGTSEIKVKFGDMTDTTTLAADNWVYNKEDGWFYYLAKLDASYSASGTAGTTNSLIKELKYGSTDERYTNVIYDLTVKMEAVQANDMAAVTDTFGLDNATGTTSVAIYNALAGL